MLNRFKVHVAEFRETMIPWNFLHHSRYPLIEQELSGEKDLHLKEFQELIHKTYYERDSKREPVKNVLKLMEEMGEFAEALLKKDPKKIEEESADLLAWIASLLNIYNVDLEKAVMEKYGEGCPRCKKIPCECEDF